MHTSRQFTLKAIAKVQPELGLTNWQVKNCDRQRKETTKLQPRYTLKAIALLVGLLTALTFSQEVHAATFNVADGDVAGLIAAINASNSNPGPDTINLAPGGTYILTYIAGPDSWHGPTGLPIVQGFSETQHESLTINGNGSTILRSDAAGVPDFRIFHALYADVVLDSLVIKGGRGSGSRCGGGGLYLNVSNTLIRNSTITDNFGVEGGGICNNNGSTLTIENSTISHNTGSGGEILNLAAVSLSISNTTIYDDQVDSNRTDSIVDAFSPLGSISIKNSIVVGPTGSGIGCYGFTPVSLGHNIFSDGTCGQNVAGGDLIVPTLTLEPLGNNGGATPTHALLSGSPAADAIPLADCTNIGGVPIVTDQRGITRPQGVRCDIGAFEATQTPSACSFTGTVSHWSAEGNANDVQAGNHGILRNGATFAPGIEGQAFSLNGGYVEVPDSPSLSITGPLTLEAWIKVSDSDTQQAVIEKYDVPGRNGYFLRFGLGKVVASICNGFTCNEYAIGATTISTGTWHHVASVYDGTSIKVYLDGALDGSVSTTIQLTDGAASLKIGARGDDANTRLNGLIDEARIFNRALTAAEIQMIASRSCGADSTAPIITPTVTGTLGNNGWYTSDVNVSWSVTDPESSVSSSTGCDSTSVTADTTGITFTCSATSGGGSASESVTIKRDATAPLVSCGSADGAWHSLDVSIACTGSDSASQLANAGDASFSLTTSVTAGTETANASTNSRNVFDNAGNAATAGPVSGNKVDKKAPTITITNPTATNYLLNQSVAANFTCQDGGSGVATCNGSAPNGNNIDTASVGSKSFTVSATDNVGNSPSPQSVAYAVGFGISVLYDQTKAAKSGSVIPIKLQLVDALGHNVSSAGLVVHAASLVQIATSASEVINDAGNANPDVNFRFDSSLGTGGGYIFNLKTTGLSTGTYKLGFIVGADPSIYWVQFAVRQ